MLKNDSAVSQCPDGSSASKKDGADRAHCLQITQAQATKDVRVRLKSSDGGELSNRDEPGKIRTNVTVPSLRTRFPRWGRAASQ